MMSSKSGLKFIIVGGVAGGMSAATRARRLSESASITVFEKGPYVSYANCGIPYSLGEVIQKEESLILNTPKSFKDRYNLDVHIDSEVVKIDPQQKTVDVRVQGEKTIERYAWDKLVLSLGAEPFLPPLKGIDLPHVFTLQTIPDLRRIRCALQDSTCVKHVAVIGGGFIGLEAAENIKGLGFEVSILEAAPQVFTLVDHDIAERIHTELRANGVSVHLRVNIKEIQPGHVMLGSGETVPADVVIAAVGVRPRTSLARDAGLKIGSSGAVSVDHFMRTSHPDIYAVGDMVETENRVLDRALPLALAGPAARQGRIAVDHALGILKEGYRGNVGTSICKVFGLAVASVGTSARVLQQMGKKPLWVTVYPPSHAGYYPRAQPLSLRVIFEPESGRLLGAQVVGKEGVDKQIDVLAMAMQAGMSISDLEHLELAYAPPYGSAKSPVNMAGFVGTNVLRGIVRIMHPEELVSSGFPLESIQLLDVRSPEEFGRGHIPGAVNISVNTLRERMDELDKNKYTVVYCGVGYRGYLAYRMLEQNGFEQVVNLDGGTSLFFSGGFDLNSRKTLQ